MSKPIKWFNFDNSKDIPEVMIYDQIGMDWWGDGLSARDFREEFNAIKANEINLHINSPGGSIYEGLAIYNTIKSHPAKINGFVDGIAASISSVVLMASDTIIMPENADLLIHKPWSGIVGNSDDMRNEADELDRLEDQIAKIYSDRTGINIKEISRMMSEERWISGNDAVEMGFADEVIENKKAAACMFDIGMFNSIPERHKKNSIAQNKRSIEDGLCDIGYSKSEAVKIASGSPKQSDSVKDDNQKQEFEELSFALTEITKGLSNG